MWSVFARKVFAEHEFVGGQYSPPADPSAIIVFLYRYLFLILGGLALLILLYWAIRKMTSGDSSAQSGAKSGIMNVIYAILMLVAAYAMLTVINPDLPKLQLPELESLPDLGGAVLPVCRPACQAAYTCTAVGDRNKCIPPSSLQSPCQTFGAQAKDGVISISKGTCANIPRNQVVFTAKTNNCYTKYVCDESKAARTLVNSDSKAAKCQPSCVSPKTCQLSGFDPQTYQTSYSCK